MLHAELRLVREEDRPIVHCPEAMRGDMRRALGAVLDELDTALMRAWRRALEGRFVVTATVLHLVREMLRKACAILKEEP